MISKNFIKLLKKLFPLIILAMIIGGIAGYYTYESKNDYSSTTTIFLSFAGHSSEKELNYADNNNLILAVDAFSESVQGWFKNPSMISRINEQAPGNIGLSAKKQEKQNILLTYKSLNASTSEKYKEAIKQNLEEFLNNYNKLSDLTFDIAVFDYYQTPISENALFYILLGLCAGIISSAGLILIFAESKN